jgi:hypothetical protein
MLTARGYRAMGRPIIAGLVYFGCVFAAGFVLGVLRTLFVVPRLGETFAVAMELPIILVVAWIACRGLTNHFVVPSRFVPRAVMGAKLDFEDFRAGDKFNIGRSIKVRTAPLNHPDGATGYRLEYRGKSVCYITDTEHLIGKQIFNHGLSHEQVEFQEPAIRNLIREGKIAQMYSAIQTGQKDGMQTLDQCLTELLQKGIVTKEEARFRAQNKDAF